ncbi:MAG: SLBB domain-containing protein [Kiritimatiellia bacterium]
MTTAGTRLCGLRIHKILAAWAVAATLVALSGHAQVPAKTETGDYVAHRILPGDRLSIILDEQPELNAEYAVAGDGTIDFPMIGRIHVAELTTEAAADLIENELEGKYFKDATVRVNVSEFVEGAILMLGALNQPGTIPYKGDRNITLLEAIASCGGLSEQAAGNEVRILRWKPGGGMERQVITVDVQAMTQNMDFSNDQFLRPRDIVMVPTLDATQAREEFLALGQLGNPGFYPYSENMDVIRAITRAGGLTMHAQMGAARLLRRKADGAYEAITLDLSRLFGGGDMSMNYPILPGDIIFVPTQGQASGGVVYILGAVMNQGAVELPLEQQVTLAKTVLKAGGFTKFANENKVKVLRTAPDGTKQTLIVDVGEILKTGLFENDIPLKAEDVIIVPEKILGF